MVEKRIKVIPLFLDDGVYKVNIVVSNLTEDFFINGTSRHSYVVSIPEWKWSSESGAPSCDEFYWHENLKDNIEKPLEKYIPEISEKLSKVNMKYLFNEYL